MIRVLTEHPIAVDSPDHTHPWGTMRDNHTCAKLLREMDGRFPRYSLLDLGCAGGQFVVDAWEDEHLAVGLEGSDYSLKHARANWPLHYNKTLFTCDISRPFTVVADGAPPSSHVLFDVITAWEVMEHIHVERLECLVDNIAHHLKPDGVFWCSINSYLNEVSSGTELHIAAHLSRANWKGLLGRRFEIDDYPYDFSVRDDSRETSWFLECRLK